MKLISRVFCLLAATMVWLPASGQDEPRVNETMVTRPPVPAAASGPLSKTSEEIVAAAQANQMQRLAVTLDDSDIGEVLKQKIQQTTIHSNPNDPNDENDRAKLLAAQEEARQKTDTLKQAVFPNGFLVRAKVFSGPAHSALLWVDVPDFESLMAILSDPRVIQVSRGQYAHLSGTNNFNLIGQPAAVLAGHGGANTTVAVIDTGFYIADSVFATDNNSGACQIIFDNAHPTQGYLAPSSRCRLTQAINFADSPPSPFCYGTCDFWPHGELVAAIVLTMAPQTKVAALQVFDINGNAADSSIVAALEWVNSNAKTSNPKIVAVNMSIDYPGIYYSGPCAGVGPIAAPIASLINNGVSVVVGAGNEGKKTGLPLPGCLPGVISVGEVYDTANVQPSPAFSSCRDASIVVDKVSCESNSDSGLTLLAPGVNISVPLQAGRLGPSSGTSFAAPHVAGAIAMLKGSDAFPNDAIVDTLHRLVATGVALHDLANNVQTPRLQIDASLGLVLWSLRFLAGSTTATVVSGQVILQVIGTSLQGNVIPNLTPSWSSTNPSVATVSTSGVVTGVSTGTTQIIATAMGISTQPLTFTVSPNGRKGGGGPTCTNGSCG